MNMPAMSAAGEAAQAVQDRLLQTCSSAHAPAAGMMRYQAQASRKYGPIFKLHGYQGVEIIVTSPELCRCTHCAGTGLMHSAPQQIARSRAPPSQHGAC